MAKPPSPRQLDYAKDIARKRNEPLPEGAELNSAICSAYIEAKKDWIPPSEGQKNLAAFIFRTLAGRISQKEYDEAIASEARFNAFADRYKVQAEEQDKVNQCRNILNGLDFVPRTLRNAISGANSAEEKLALLKTHRAAGQGFSGLEPSSLGSIAEKLSGYWMEGLLSSAFDAFGKLDNVLGEDPKASFDYDGLVQSLEKTKSAGVEAGGEPVPVWHLVLKLITPGSKKDPIVLSVLPISPVEDTQDPRRYRWGQALETVPRFNRNYMGETAKVPALMLDNVDAFDAWALELSDEGLDDDTPPGGLADALSVWDEAFDILSAGESGSVSRFRGVRGWIQRFQASQHLHWQVRKCKPVFVLVDGSAGGGATRNVCAAYRQILGDSDLLAQPELALFRKLATVIEAPRRAFDPLVEAADFEHLGRYLGHMDAFKEGKREAFPLDPAQRDALIALATTGHGQTLAVNGPPGTGKTSLLRGVIASLWIEPLLRDTALPDCPLILACAATNQAVTNVISSFDETPGPTLFNEATELDDQAVVTADSRWLPHLVSYGWYAPANADKREVQRDYQAYQYIGRSKSHMPWQFYGQCEGLNALSADHAEVLFLACAERFFGVRLSIEEVLVRLRREVIRGARAIGKVQEAAAEWQAHFVAFSSTPPWTTEEDKRRRDLREALAALTGKAGRYAQVQGEIEQLEKVLKALFSLQANIQPDGRIVDEILAGKKSRFSSWEQQYRQLRRLDHDMEALSEQIEELRHATLLQRIRQSVASVIAPAETKRKWENLREAMQACGLPSSGNGRPDFTEWSHAILARRTVLHGELRTAAAQVLVARTRALVALPGDEVLPPDSDWRTDLSKRVNQIQVRRAALLGEVMQLQERLEQGRATLDALDKVHAAYTAARSAAETAGAKLLAALRALGDELPAGHALPGMLANALDRHDSFEEGRLAQHRRDLIKHLQDWLDQNLRPRLFHLAARYWEGRFVLSKKNTHARVSKDVTFSPPSETQLREMAMLAPVFVVTAFSAPKLMRRQLLDVESDQPPYLFGEADLLIVDEAGQGTPEVGASAFLFAKRAIVVGDVEQLDPVWSHDEAGDRLLVQRFVLGARITPDDDAYRTLAPGGVLLACGSVMRMAQRISWRSAPNAQAAGLTLTNHYRCLEPIIEICNRMVYRGALQVATRSPKKLWRPELKRLGYLVVDAPGDTANPGGSRRNLSEAATIARWLRENEASLVQHFSPDGQKDLADIVAIVTPFRGQKSYLKEAIAKAFGYARIDYEDELAIYNRMTIDTVHSLQGAEKSVVIFSMVESSTPSEPQFYDRGTNLINVAISRAKEMFVVALSQTAVDYAGQLTEKTLHKPSDYLWHAAVTKGSRLNSRHIVMVESPNKRDTIHAALGGSIEWEIIDTGGHITDLAPPEAWDIGQTAEPVWGPLQPSGEQALARLQALWPGLVSLYLATDPDPEGEAISWHILRVIQERQADGKMIMTHGVEPAVKRMRFHRLDAEEIKRAQREAADGLDAGLVKSALTRNFLDRLVATRYAQRLGLASTAQFVAGIGRVQLGILDLVHKAGLAQRRFGIRVDIPVAEGESLSTYLALRGNQGHDRLAGWNTEGEAATYRDKLAELLADPDADVTASWSGRLVQHPPYPAVNTARLLALAYRALGMAPARAMAELQALYEGTAQRAPFASASLSLGSTTVASKENEMEVFDA